MLRPESLDVVMLSMEGPDRYALAGGLGVRARELTRALAAAGATVTLAFVGDPDMPGEETVAGVRLVRWAQHISAEHPAGVYQGEEQKLADLERAFPAWLCDHVAALPADRTGVLLAEEWQTAQTTALCSDALAARGVRDRCLLLWNANNVFGFERIDWPRLTYAATLTTVSRYMRHLMLPHDVSPLVIPNGIPAEALQPVDAAAVRRIRQAAHADLLAFKIGRFSPDKRWHQAVSAVARLRRDGVRARLLLRGGIEPFGGEVVAHARAEGLEVVDWYEPVRSADEVAEALAGSGGAPLVNLRTFLPDALIPQIDAAAGAVLANSGHEPFGLVGLEAMAAGGVALVGATGEEYARAYVDAIVVETDDPGEVAGALRGLVERPDLAARLRRAARLAAGQYTWDTVIDGLCERLRYVAARQGVTTA